MNALFAGSFHPPTNGHLDVIRRAAAIFDTVYVAVMANAEKRYLFSAEKRVKMLEKCTADMPNVRVVQGSGLTVNTAKALGAQALVRGVRDAADYEYEKKLADINYALSGVETVLLPARPELNSLASSIVMDIAQNEGDISAFVPKEILSDILTAIKEGCAQ